MKTVVVPFDFSKTSLNAAEYATRMLTGYYGITMILYHAYKDAADRDEVMRELDRLREHLRTVGIVKTEIVAGQSQDFIASLEHLCLDVKADLVIMGITGRSAVEQKLIGSNTMRMAERRVCPVLIVPPDSRFREVKNVVLASEMRQEDDRAPASALRKVLLPFRPKIHILNVDETHFVAITEAYQQQMDRLRTLFQEFETEFYFLDLHDADEAISQFTTDKNADILIYVHRQKSFMDKLFRGSHTQKMAYQSRIPLLVIHA